MESIEGKQELLSSSGAPGMAARLVRALGAVARSPAAWFFAAVWLVSIVILTVTSGELPTLALLIAAGYLLFSLITVAITEPALAPVAAPAERPRLWLQIGLLLLLIGLTTWGGLAFHNVVAPDSLPLWSSLLNELESLGGRWFGNDNYVANPVTYFVIPLLLLLLAGARLPELGFGRGQRVGRVLLLWCVLPVAYLAYALLVGPLTLTRLGGRLLSNFMQNGFFEEFLFRGALQTRLGRLWGPAWALVLQSLLFGAWHLGLGFTNTDHAGFLPALASVLAHQAVVGLAFGVIFSRTRNLIAPSVVHILVNSLGL